MKEDQMSRIIGLVGPRGSGKTSLILDLVRELRNCDLKISGFVSPGIFEGEEKIAIELIDLQTHEGRLLAVAREEEALKIQFGDWSFLEETLDWANQRLKDAPISDLLVIDEIGPLELDYNKGLKQGLARLSGKAYKLALITLRPRCARSAQCLFPGIELIYVQNVRPDEVKKTIFRIANSL
jgi:nucleoside-triphosphatase THEP1